jgi:hypothetical protein
MLIATEKEYFMARIGKCALKMAINIHPYKLLIKMLKYQSFPRNVRDLKYIYTMYI